MITKPSEFRALSRGQSGINQNGQGQLPMIGDLLCRMDDYDSAVTGALLRKVAAHVRIDLLACRVIGTHPLVDHLRFGV